MWLNRKDKPNNTPPVKISQPLKTDTVSFTSCISNSGPLTALLRYRIPDLYSPIILLNPAKATEISNSHVFSSTIENITKALMPYTDSLFPIEFDFYNLMSESAKKTPNKTFHRFIASQFPEHNRILVDKQLQIFKELKDAALDFPADLLERFTYLMYISEQKINMEPVFIPFSNKEFKYKLNKICNRIMSASPVDEEISAVKKLTSIAGDLPDVSRKSRQVPGFDFGKYEDQQKKMIGKFVDALTKSVLANDEDLLNLTLLAEQRIYNVPTFIRFNRQSFIYDLRQITSELSNKSLAYYVNKTAKTLPTSKNNLSAFIVKAEGRSPEQAGFDMISGSIGSVDHFIATHNGGKDVLSNLVLASARMNTLKGDEFFSEFYRKNKNIAEYAQAQIDRFIELANTTRAFRKYAELNVSYIKSMARMIESDSKDPTLKLDTHELK